MHEKRDRLWAGVLSGRNDRRVVEEIGVLPTIVATGDSAGVIVPHCKHTVLVDDELALKGLKIIYDKNVEENTHRQKGGCSC